MSCLAAQLNEAAGEMEMPDSMYPSPTRELAQMRRDLAPESLAAFHAFSQKVFEPGALDARTKQIIAVAAAHVTQCPYCIRGHTKAALREGASEAELMEAIWVAAEMRAGASYAHSLLALAEMEPRETTEEGERDVGHPAEAGRS
jgi:AhpD family alkylhydroperoxidase